jgi:hypothetical protein
MHDVLQKDGAVARKLVAKKLDVPYDRAHRTEASVRVFVEELLQPINARTLDVRSTMKLADFVERVYIPDHVEKRLRQASQKQYKDVWNLYVKPRVGTVTRHELARDGRRR